MAQLLVNAGKAILTNRIKAGGTEPVYIGWGTGAGTTAATDTTLFTESSESRTTGTSVRITTTVTNDTWQLTGTIVATGSRAITNAGCFDAATVGNLFVKGDFTVINLGNGDGIAFTINWQIT